MLDASAFKESSCIKRTFNTVIQGYKSRVNENVIEFGVAFHKFREMIRRDSTKFGEALLAAKQYYITTPKHTKKNKEYLTPDFLWTVCNAYYTKYLCDRFKPKKHKGEALLELPFSFPYLIEDDVEILMAGTIDEIGNYGNSQLDIIMDAKTTGIWDVKEYFRGFKLSPQMIFYRWAIRKYAESFPNSWVKEMDINDVGCVIDGIFYGGKEEGNIQLLRSNVMLFPERLVQELDQLIRVKVQELLVHVREWLATGKVPMKYGMLNGACETVYGKCKFFNSCCAPDEEAEQFLLEKDYVKGFYNPLAFHN